MVSLNIRPRLRRARNRLASLAPNEKTRRKIKHTIADPVAGDVENQTYLVTLDGQHTEVRTVSENGDDRALEWTGEDGEPRECAITSKPMLISGNKFYFTRDGFLGTMALHEHTLLAADEYQIGDSVDYENGETYDPESMDPERAQGELGAMYGSKKTLAVENKAKRSRALLNPPGVDRATLMLALGAGAFLGYLATVYIQRGGM